MMKKRPHLRKKRLLLLMVIICAVAVSVVFFLAYTPVPTRITYGMSFNTPYVLELGLDPEVVYTALLDELKVRHLRLAAHWTMIEPQKDAFDFSALDFQIDEAHKRGADVILAVGRRLPRWPECHVPKWARTLSWDEQKDELRGYLTAVVNRYKHKPNIIYWQVENEPYLRIFAQEECGTLDEDFLKEEIALVRSLDGTRAILVTDSGNLGTWNGAYSAGDAFGTSVYVYFWNQSLGKFRTVLPPSIYRIKENIMKLFHGTKPTFLIELSLEPWLVDTVSAVPIDIQLGRMNPQIFDEVISYAKETRFDRQYLWGAEWWYWLRERGHPEMWEKGTTLFQQ